MATNKNDIALSFDKAEYYSLQEASDYLNRKHGIDNVTPKKLLKQIANRKINAYIHFRTQAHNNFSFSVHIDSDNIVDNQQLTEKLTFNSESEKFDYLLSLYHELERLLEAAIIDDLYMGFILFQVSNEFLNNLAMAADPTQSSNFLIFDGILGTDEPNGNPNAPALLKKRKLKKHGIEFEAYNIGAITLKTLSNSDDDLQRAIENLPFKCSFTKRENFSFIDVYLTIHDLLIIHHDLEALEKQIIENAPIPEKQLPTIDHYGLPKRKGLSPKLQQAKLIANAHAQHLWAKDYDKKIRIGEMCEHVWGYMITTAYRDQLPNDAKSLKDWLTDIPEYASQAGRPSEK